MVKRFLLIPLLVLVISGLMLSGCPAPAEEPTAEEPAAEESVLRVAWVESPPKSGTINPLRVASATGYGWHTLIYEPLWIPTLEGDVVPWLAKSWEYKEDEEAWIVNLDERATWSDGEPVTAEDVKFTLETCFEYKFTMGSGLEPFVDSIVAVDDHTVRFNMAEVYGHFVLEAGSVFIVPEHIWSKIDDISQFTNPSPIGSGPFLFQEFQPKSHLIAVKNPNYWRGPVGVDKVVYKVYTNPDAKFMALMKGEIDVVPTIRGSFTVIPILEVDPDIQYMELEGGYTAHLLPNRSRYPLDLKEVLQAMSLVIDREMIVDIVFDSRAFLPLMGFVPPCYEYYADTTLTWPGLDMTEEERIAEANAMLDGLGFEPGKDGIRVTDKGTKMAFNLVVPNWPAFVRGSEVIKDNLEKIGIAIDIYASDPHTVYAGIVYNPDSREDWDFLGPTNSTVSGLRYICNEYAPMDPTNFWMTGNACCFKNEEIQSLLWQVNKTTDAAETRELMMQFQQLFAEYLPTIPLCHKSEPYAYRTDRFTGWDNTHIMMANFTFPAVSLLTLTSLRPK